MRIPNRTIVIWSMQALSVCLFSCEKPKQGEVLVSEYDFYIERVTEMALSFVQREKLKMSERWM